MVCGRAYMEFGFRECGDIFVLQGVLQFEKEKQVEGLVYEFLDFFVFGIVVLVLVFG